MDSEGEEIYMNNMFEDSALPLIDTQVVAINLNGEKYHEETTNMIMNISLRDDEPALPNPPDQPARVIPKPRHNIREKRKSVYELLTLSKLEKYRWSKLTLGDVLKIGQENLKKTMITNLEEVPWHFLQNLMALNGTARNTQLDPSLLNIESSSSQDEDNDFFDETDTSDSIHPLDMLCSILHCSDSFLQQEIVTKMSMCQFAVPLLLPAGDSSGCTLMLWALRDIVKRWRPHSLVETKGCIEDSLVSTPMTTISFVRLGECNLSKSKILNHVLSPVQQHHDYFVHQNMEGGNIQREISDGLVEISWYFPAGRENSDVFSEPVAVNNLRGDLETNWNQFCFLSQISSAMFIFTESINDREYSLLLNATTSDTQYYIIIAPFSRCINEETQKNIKMLYPVLNISRKNILVKNNTVNDAELVKKVQFIIEDVIKNSPKIVKLEEMSSTAVEFGIHVDENTREHQRAKEIALEITDNIQDVVGYKSETMRMQGDLWKQLSQTEKELCRLKKQGNERSEDYIAKLTNKYSQLRKEQSEQELSDGVTNFIAALRCLSQTEVHYFLKWMKFLLDSIARHNLSALQAEYKENCSNLSTNLEKLKQLDQKILNSSLGVEHFMREVGQFYEAEFTKKGNEETIEELMKLSRKIPGIAADLLLDGFPLELIDGDASNIPLQWVTDVLSELDNKTGGGCRLRVITVLGVQSTGKSTLLNTMFGLQFPVASGRCTRGAFMTLIKIKENFKEELGCDFILVIDTEGLKAPELASLEDSYEHDNELATLVIGLSDITIINMAMENTAEMKDILQIVVHAFLRMKEIGKKPNCQFVHQNVSDVSAHEKNTRDRKKLLEQLDEMIKVAAKMEEKNNVTTFADIMEYDDEENSWYIPGLWHGVPPMASVNTGYSEKVFELKRHLFEILKKRGTRNIQNISDFLKWIKSLWNAVKYEKFIFSFRNSLVAEAYNNLCIKYSELEWSFRKKMHKWMTEAENEIRNQPVTKLHTDMCADIKGNMYCALQVEESIIVESLGKYFDGGYKYAHLIERYREDFFRSITCLTKEYEDYLWNKCEEVFSIQKGKYEIQSVQDGYLKTIEEKARRLLENCRNKKFKLSDKEIESEFEIMWNETLSSLQLRNLTRRDVGREILEQLRKDMRNKVGYVNEKLNGVNSLAEYGHKSMKIELKYTQSSWFQSIPETFHADFWYKVNDLASSLLEKCTSHITEQKDTIEDYHQTYCQEILSIINGRLNQTDAKNLHTIPLFELDLKLHILGKITPIFQKIHDEFVQENSPKLCMEKLKPQYFSIFKCIYHEKDECLHRAQRFCESCLKPALTVHMNKNLGKEIVNDILTSGDSIKYSSRTFFQFSLLKELLEKKIFAQYIKYSSKYESFVKKWIKEHIINKYRKSTDLEVLKLNILLSLKTKIRDVLKNPKIRESSDVANFLQIFCDMLKKDLVISKNEMKVVIFQNTANVYQFSDDIDLFLGNIEDHIIKDAKLVTIEAVLSKVTMKPQDELFKKVFGCGRQCPFCNVPCEAGAADHKEHFASVHRPQGLGAYRCVESKALSHAVCSADVVGDTTFQNADTEWKPHPYKDYRKYYPDWAIQPDPTIGASDYWKFIFKEFNREIAEYYNAKPALLEPDWFNITQEQALQSLNESFNMI
ncbi:up-regulator of cell proliferation-like [Bombina bombina]|uniref:up-regulator of cell proliferation-like n=1 Tax=Bombina bombina TaxID=8345 RepID=UPI00235AC554|nr:up-regulator of cell proliferation-like [Bombina bombina]